MSFAEMERRMLRLYREDGIGQNGFVKGISSFQ